MISRTLAERPKVFAFDALTCEALENFDLSVSTADYLQPFPSVVIELPQDYTRKQVVPFEEGSHAPDFVIVPHEPEADCVLVTMHLSSHQVLLSGGLTLIHDGYSRKAVKTAVFSSLAALASSPIAR